VVLVLSVTNIRIYCKNGSAPRHNQNQRTASRHSAARHLPHFHPCRGLLPANKTLPTNHHSKGNAASSLFQQSISTETPWTQETGETIKVVRNKVQQLEIDIKIETFYIPQVFAQCTAHPRLFLPSILFTANTQPIPPLLMEN